MTETNASDTKPPEPLTDAQRGDLFHRLAKAAQDRHFSRRDVEWKLAIGIWSIFAAGALGIVTLSKPIPVWGGLLAILLTGIAVASYLAFYLPHFSRATRLDQQNCYFWESGIQCLLKTEVPDPIRPPSTPERAWIRMTDPYTGAYKDESMATDAADTWFHRTRAHLHRLQWMQLCMALLFWLLFVGAIATKMLGPAGHDCAKVSVEGDLEIDSMSKFKLGR